jgi:hypothetical protein
MSFRNRVAGRLIKSGEVKRFRMWGIMGGEPLTPDSVSLEIYFRGRKTYAWPGDITKEGDEFVVQHTFLFPGPHYVRVTMKQGGVTEKTSALLWVK